MVIYHGTLQQKTAVYEAPYISIFTELFSAKSAYENLTKKGCVEFLPTTFIRGVTWNNCIIVVDEIQNMSSSELHTIITRVGKNCKIILCGDGKQKDFMQGRTENTLSDFLTILLNMNEFSTIEYTKEDIVRSGLVKSYMLMRDKLEENGQISVL